MKKYWKLILLAVAAVSMTACGFGNLDDDYGTEAKLLGKWQNEKNPGWYRVFTADKVVIDGDDADYSGYKWGKEWNEDEDIFESDLVYHGNGWFMWRKNNANLFEIHYMDYDFAQIPQENKILILNDSSLIYSEQDGRSVQFRKVK